MERANRRRYYVAYGGRGSAKSWTFARALLIQCQHEPLRVLCCREVMRTISESVHQLLVDQIKALGLEGFYDVGETSIRGANGSEFLFAGLRSMDVHKIKSYEGIDIAWVEEAQAVSKKSWDILIPTIRAPRSEIWVTFNPELDTDDTYQRFVAHPPEGAWVQRVTWLDNPWFPEVLEKERQHLQKTDPDAHAHVWGGAPRTVVEGAIYAKEVTAMVEERRITRVPYDPKLPVHTIWDLGWNDQTSIIFAQKVVSEVRIIDYEEESFLRFDEWAKRLKEKPYNYGEHYLPHDGANNLQAAGGLSAQKILTPLLRQRPKIIPRPPSVEVPIRAARMLFPRVYVDEAKAAADGLPQALPPRRTRVNWRAWRASQGRIPPRRRRLRGSRAHRGQDHERRPTAGCRADLRGFRRIGRNVTKETRWQRRQRY
jgi:phage terminase large subunit